MYTQEEIDQPYRVYLITNVLNGMAYVGQTRRSGDVRWKEHQAYARQGRGGYLYNAMRRHGFDAFVEETLETADTPEKLNDLECQWIARLGTTDKSRGYNLMTGGASPSPNQETRDKLSRALKGKQAWNKGLVGWATPEISAKLSESHRGFRHTEESKRKCRESKQGVKNPNFGKTFTPEESTALVARLWTSQPWSKTSNHTEEAKTKMRGPRPLTSGPRPRFRGENNKLFMRSASETVVRQLRSMGFPRNDIARMLGCSTQTVGNRLKGWPACQS